MFDRKAIRKDVSGQRFGRLQVLWPAGKTRRGFIWTCQCDDGNVIAVAISLLLNGHTGSCGCIKREHMRQLGHAAATHNASFTPEYAAYAGAQSRCTCPTNAAYDLYGGRGIKFLFASFEEFLSHIGPKPSPELELDRIDNGGHYEIGNVRWATLSQQNKNRRPHWLKVSPARRREIGQIAARARWAKAS